MLWCESVAPLGKPVVPEVYWMLIGSSGSQRRLARVQVGLGHALAVGEQLVPVVLEDERLAQLRAARAHLVSIAT